MPKVEVTGVTVTHTWDDESTSDIEINKGHYSDSGPYVSVKDGDDTVYLRPESWPEIRDQIQSLMDSIGVSDTDS